MTRSAQPDHAALADLLATQHQVISRKQALARGLTERAVQYRVRIRGSWQRLLPGVFLAVTGTPTDDQRDIAAQLYAGSDSRITGLAALRRWGVRAPYTNLIDMLIPAEKQRASTGFVRIHGSSRMPEQTFTVGPVSLVPIPRAVADSARGLTRLADVRALVANVIQQGRCSADQLIAELEDGPVQGSALLRIAIADIREGVRSNPEADLKDLLKWAKIRTPMFNPRLYSGDEFLASPDGWWPDLGVAAEVDSREYHLSPKDHERTLERHARMAAHGITVLHFTPRQIRTQPTQVAAILKAALVAARGRPTLNIRTIPPRLNQFRT
jgi:hypothetical protein